jgi:hypothetical protein
MLFRDDVLRYEIHAASRWIGRHQLSHCDCEKRQLDWAETRVPELAMHIAITDPMNHAQTAVAGPPDAIGVPKVAGTDPKTPRMEIAYETVLHLVNSRFSSYPVRQNKVSANGVLSDEPVDSLSAPTTSRHHRRWWPWADQGQLD